MNDENDTIMKLLERIRQLEDEKRTGYIPSIRRKRWNDKKEGKNNMEEYKLCYVDRDKAWFTNNFKEQWRR